MTMSMEAVLKGLVNSDLRRVVAVFGFSCSCSHPESRPARRYSCEGPDVGSLMIKLNLSDDLLQV